MKVDIGKFFEHKKMEPALGTMQSRYGVYFHRFKDSHSAGRITSSAPADYLVSWNGDSYLVEAKASRKHASLKSCLANMVDDGQVGSHDLWHRAGNHSWFCFYSDVTGMVEMWPGTEVIEARHAGTPLDRGPACTFEATDMVNGLRRIFR